MLYLREPIRHERVRGFQPPWRHVFVYKCKDCGKETRLFCPRSGMPPGAVLCACEIEKRGLEA